MLFSLPKLSFLFFFFLLKILCFSALSSHYWNFHFNSRCQIIEAMQVWWLNNLKSSSQCLWSNLSETVQYTVTAVTYFNTILEAQRAVLVDFPSNMCVRVCVYLVCVCACIHICHKGNYASPCKLCVSVIISRSVLSFVWVCVHAACCGVLFISFFFLFFSLNGILSMKTSDWTKYHGTHQGRCAQCDCLSLCHHSFLFKQSFNSNRLPKTQTQLCVTLEYI